MGSITSQITSLTIVYSIVYSNADQRKHQSSASLAFVRGIQRGPVNSPHKWPVTRKMFPFVDVIMVSQHLLKMDTKIHKISSRCQSLSDNYLYRNPHLISLCICFDFLYINFNRPTESEVKHNDPWNDIGAISRLTQFETIGLRRDFMHGQQPAANHWVSGDCVSQYYARENKIGEGQLGLSCYQKVRVKIPICI